MWGVNKNASISFAGGAAFGDRLTVSGGIAVTGGMPGVAYSSIIGGGLGVVGAVGITGRVLIFDGLTVGVNGGKTDLLGDVEINQNSARTLLVKGPATFQDSVSIGKGLSVTSGATVTGGLAVFGAFTVNGAGVVGAGAALSTNTFTGLQTMNAGITTNHLYVSNGATFAGDVRIKGITGGLSVTGGATVTGGLAVFGAFTVNGSPISSVGGNIPLASATVTGAASFGNEFVVSGLGAVSLTSNYVKSFNGATGVVTFAVPLASSSATGAASFGNQFVVSAAGAVSLTSNYVISVNGSTGTVIGIATTGSNTFTGLQTMNAGLTSNHLYVSNGVTFANGLVVSSGGITGTLNTASQTNITSIGTLTRLDVGAGGISSAGGITGTLNTAAQPNITSVGVLTALNVTGSMNVTGNATFRNGINVTNGITGTLNTSAQPNITSVGVLTALNVTAGLNVTGGITGTLLTAAQPNITAVGTLARLDVGAGGIVSSGGVTGTLNTAAQPNVTSLGVLTSLNVTGALAVTGASRFVGNSTFANGINVTNGITGTLNTAAQPNITAVGTLTSLTTSGLGTFNGGLTTNHLYVSQGATFAKGLSVTGGTAYFNNDITVSGNHPGLPSYIYESNSGITYPGSSVSAFTIGDKWTNGSEEYTWIGNAWIQVDNVVSSGTNPANDMSNVAYRNVAQTFTARQNFASGASATHVQIDTGLTVGFNARTTLLGDVEINETSGKNLQINAGVVNIKNNLVIGSNSSTLNSPSSPDYFGTGVPVLELRGKGVANTAGYCGVLQFASSPPSSPTVPIGGSGAAYIWSQDGVLRFGTGATMGAMRTRCRMTDDEFSVDSGNLKVGFLPTQDITTTVDGVQLTETGVITINQRFATTSFVDIVQFYRGMTGGVNSNKVGQIKASTSAVAYETTSDYRLKQDIQPMAGGLEKIKLLKPCTYVWKNTGETAQGFIAHEVQEIIHDVVSGTKDEVDEHGNPKYQGIDQSKLVATLTNAIQELNALVEAQQVEINNLKNRLM